MRRSLAFDGQNLVKSSDVDHVHTMVIHVSQLVQDFVRQPDQEKQQKVLYTVNIEN